MYLHMVLMNRHVYGNFHFHLIYLDFQFTSGCNVHEHEHIQTFTYVYIYVEMSKDRRRYVRGAHVQTLTENGLSAVCDPRVLQ